MSDKVLAKGWAHSTGGYICTYDVKGRSPHAGDDSATLRRLTLYKSGIDGACELHAEAMGVFEPSPPTATKQPEAVRATCRPWCGTKFPGMKDEVFWDGARYVSEIAHCALSCADAKRAKAKDLPPTVNEGGIGPKDLPHAGENERQAPPVPSVAPLPAREWKAPTDRPWGPALYDPETSARLATTISHVAKLPDTFGTSRTPLERYNAAHRPMWSKGVELAHIVKRWK